MVAVIRFLFLAVIKILSRVLYRMEVSWVGTIPQRPFEGLNLGILLNHTSLFEPLYVGVIPFSLLWDIAKRGVFPGADITMSRPIVGIFFRLIVPNAVSITRRPDSTWQQFLSLIHPGSIVIIAPEGRMKRATGLDKHGKPMTVRGGVTDIIQILKRGRMLLIYSGGLHHVHTPGQRFPKFFKKIRVALEVIDIEDYCQKMGSEDSRAFKIAVVKDLEERRDKYCPQTNEVSSGALSFT